ncbi:MAG: B12-binding domain-containing radical SAM protein [Deltaproteobacteria bacterium]|nr:B12-binding domain-containing radical SAM protein [Deltaproteobacteria bacterium]
MRVLLAVPPRPRDQVLQILPPLGLGYLATALARGGHEARIVDLTRARGDLGTWRRELEAFRPELIGLTAFTSDLPTLEPMCAEARRSAPGAPTILGGPHASADPRATLREVPSLDLAFRGEGEAAIVAIADELAAGGTPDPSRIAGLAVREGSDVRASDPRFPEDLDALGFPDWDALDPLGYQRFPPTLFVRQRPFAPLVVTRGCPYRCTFCAGFTVTGRTMRSRSVEHVMSEIELLHRRFGIREIHIEDDNFTWDREFVIRFSRALAASRLGISWTMPNGVRLETLEREMLREMRAGGCYALIVGIESGSPRILKRMRKALTLPLIEEKVRLARAEGFPVHGFFMLGYPDETAEDVQATLDLALKLDLTGANFHSFRPLPGTVTGEALRDEGLIEGWASDPDRGSFSNPVFAPVGLSPRWLKSMQRKMLLKFYGRPRILLGTAWRASSSGAAWPLARKALTYLT